MSFQLTYRNVSPGIGRPLLRCPSRRWISRSIDQTDPFVLEMSYDASLVESYHDPLFLAWLGEGEWMKAVNGNFGWGGSAEAEFAGSWDAFVTANGLDPANDLPDYLGSWGVDTTASTAWAVLNHNSQFAVLAIPEPGTWLLLLCAFACGLLLRRRAK